MSQLTTSVLIPSYNRPDSLQRCVTSLVDQTIPPGEVIIVWQSDDVATETTATRLAKDLPVHITVLNSETAGVVPAETVAKEAATGDVLLLIDDDATAPHDWIERHLRHYEDSSVGAVGGPADNYHMDGTPFPRRDAEPTGQLTWYGKLVGNMYDQPNAWRQRPPVDVHHLVGYNMSMRRSAVTRFEEALRPYWQNFEVDACLQISTAGYRIVFDYGIVINHYPLNQAYTEGRDGDLQIKILNAAYNRSFVLAKWSPWYLRLPRLAYAFAVGTVGQPGLLGSLVAWQRFGNISLELKLLLETWRSHMAGWANGSKARHELIR